MCEASAKQYLVALIIYSCYHNPFLLQSEGLIEDRYVFLFFLTIETRKLETILS